MRLRFWNRWKREKKTPSIKDLVNAHEIHHVQSRPIQGITDFGDLSYEDMLPSQREQWRLESMKQDREIFGRVKDQCHGKLKSGARCSRIVKKAMYCHQHKLK